MSAEQLIRYLSWAVFLLIFAVVTIQALRQPQRANIDIALFFAVPTLIIAISVAASFGLVQAGRLLNAINSSLFFAMVYMLLRLVDDFADVPVWLMRAAGIGLAALVVAAFAISPPQPALVTLVMLLYLVALLIYAAVAFVREAHRTSGVTKRRMHAVAAGTLSIVVLFIFASLALVFPSLADLWRSLSNICGLVAAICYFLGFAPPRLLRRSWQEPELRAFLGKAASLPRLPDTGSILRELEAGAAASVGAPNASIGLWDEAEQVLRFFYRGEEQAITPEQRITTGRAFLTQRAAFTPDAARDNPAEAERRREEGAVAVLAAPISAGAKRLGVLVVYAPHAPIFADDDLELVQLLADQAAVILESRALIDQAARVQAREEATRLKDDFLSAAAHDLKTPLTTLVAKAQFMERRALRNPEAPADLAGIQTLVQEGQRLKRLVLDLLDAARAEQGRLVSERTEVDLVALARETCERQHSERHPCVLESNGAVIGHYDQVRILQLIENLIENAMKYSPEGGAVRMKIWREDQEARFDIVDNGIGIPPGDLPHIFDRFYRGANVDDRRFAGMGLGLFICRGIAEQHGGRIWASSRPGLGSTFHVALPLATHGDSGHA